MYQDPFYFETKKPPRIKHFLFVYLFLFIHIENLGEKDSAIVTDRWFLLNKLFLCVKYHTQRRKADLLSFQNEKSTFFSFLFRIGFYLGTNKWRGKIDELLLGEKNLLDIALLETGIEWEK